MSDATLGIVLVVLIFISAFFSAAETALMSINRYRLRHLAKSGNRAAILVSRLLERPDKLLSVILIGNTFANIMASATATILAANFFGEVGVLVCTIVLTFVVLIFAEVTPKTLAALQPLSLSLWAAWPLTLLKKILYPLVWLINKLALGLLQIFGVHVSKQQAEALNADELRTLLNESGQKISGHHKGMLLGILDLTKATVNDIMVPKNEITGIDLSDDWNNILAQLTTSQYTRLPVYRDSIDKVQGILHLRDAMRLLGQQQLNKDNLLKACSEAYYVPESTPLSGQLLNFQKTKRRSALVVDEYGDILGLITLEDILEEIVGEFTTDEAELASKDVYASEDGSFIIDGSKNIRELNREMNWELPTEGAKTVSGAIIEYLETIPAAQTCLRLVGYPIEILQVKDNMIKNVRIMPKLRTLPPEESEYETI